MRRSIYFNCLKYFCIFSILFCASVSFIPEKIVQAQESSKVLEWEAINKPGSDGNIVIHPSEVSKIAVGSGVIYSIDSQNSKIYSSNNGGTTFTDITYAVISSGLPLPATNLAIAPDNSSVVALVTNNNTDVWVSTDGAATWQDTYFSSGDNTSIQCITISNSSASKWYIAVGTAKFGDNVTQGQLWTIQIGSITSSWKRQDLTVTKYPSSITTNGEISAIAFSANNVILVLASTGSTNITDSGKRNRTFLCQGKKGVLAGDPEKYVWNQALVYPVPLNYGSPPMYVPGDNPSTTRVISSILLPSNYNSATENRTLFVSYNRRSVPQEPGNDIYRIAQPDNNTIEVLRMNAGYATGELSGFANIASIDLCTGAQLQNLCVIECNPIALPKNNILIAGDYFTTWPFVQIRICPDPFSNPPFVWQPANQPPTGPGSAQVVTSSDSGVIYCGTSQIPEFSPPIPDESAFSISSDSGYNWQQVSIIDTALQISDVAPAPDSHSVFLASSSPAFESVWRSSEPVGKYWGRIMSMLTTVTENRTSKLILRLSPYYNSDYTIYASEVGGNQIAYSHVRGNVWTKRLMPFNPVDLILFDSDTACAALPQGFIRITYNEACGWQNFISTGLTEINMMSLTGNGQLLIGSREGKVALSMDGAKSFVIIPQMVGEKTAARWYIPGMIVDVQVMADVNYSKNKILYAATNVPDVGIWRWTIGSSSDWEQLDKGITDSYSGQKISGLAMGVEGTLYASRSDPVKNPAPNLGIPGPGGMERSLNPLSDSQLIEWDVVNRTLPDKTTFDPMSPAPNSFPPPAIIPFFNNTLPFIKISGDETQNELWTIATNNYTDHKIYRFIDNICKVGSFIQNDIQVGCDPVSGRNQEFALAWEQLSLSDRYEISVSKDTVFTLDLQPVEPSNNPYFLPYKVTSPQYYVKPADPLECGHGYYWRVRTRHTVTGEFIRSPWSKTGKFVLKAGFKVTTSYYGCQPLAPSNGSNCPCGSPIGFSWTPYNETTSYIFELSDNANMDNPIVSAIVKGTTAYQYREMLKCNNTYFWRVIAWEPSLSEWSAVFSFNVLPQVELPVIPTPAPVLIPGVTITPLTTWIIIALWFLLIILILIYIMVRRRLAEQENDEDEDDGDYQEEEYRE